MLSCDAEPKRGDRTHGIDVVVALPDRVVPRAQQGLLSGSARTPGATGQGRVRCIPACANSGKVGMAARDLSSRCTRIDQ